MLISHESFNMLFYYVPWLFENEQLYVISLFINIYGLWNYIKCTRESNVRQLICRCNHRFGWNIHRSLCGSPYWEIQWDSHGSNWCEISPDNENLTTFSLREHICVLPGLTNLDHPPRSSYVSPNKKVGLAFFYDAIAHALIPVFYFDPNNRVNTLLLTF